MKRDLDLVRKLMLGLEELAPGTHADQIVGDFGADPVTILAHFDLMINAGLLEGYSRPIPGHPNGGMFRINEITWAGHDFIDSAKSDTVWNIVKERIRLAGSWTFGLMLELLKEEAKSRLVSILPK